MGVLVDPVSENNARLVGADEETGKITHVYIGPSTWDEDRLLPAARELVRGLVRRIVLRPGRGPVEERVSTEWA